MDEDVFPIETWGFSNVMLVLQGCKPTKSATQLLRFGTRYICLQSSCFPGYWHIFMIHYNAIACDIFYSMSIYWIFTVGLQQMIIILNNFFIPCSHEALTKKSQQPTKKKTTQKHIFVLDLDTLIEQHVFSKKTQHNLRKRWERSSKQRSWWCNSWIHV